MYFVLIFSLSRHRHWITVCRDVLYPRINTPLYLAVFKYFMDLFNNKVHCIFKIHAPY